MPTYTYECEECSHKFNFFQKMVDPKKKKCPECKKMRLIRLIGSGITVVFKGPGFHCNDYPKPSGE